MLFHYYFCRFFYASSACIYPEFKQLETTNVSLKESDAWPAEVLCFLISSSYSHLMMKTSLDDTGMHD